MRFSLTAVLMVTFGFMRTAVVSAHCQIPCGIYDDELRVKQLEEHATTIEKSMKQIVELSAAGEKNWNQLVRWISNKDDHVEQFSHIVTYYFMTQRIKPTDAGDSVAREKYVKELTLLHEMLVYAMKAAQTTDLDNVQKLRSLISEFRTSYFGENSHAH